MYVVNMKESQVRSHTCFLHQKINPGISSGEYGWCVLRPWGRVYHWNPDKDTGWCMPLWETPGCFRLLISQSIVTNHVINRILKISSFALPETSSYSVRPWKIGPNCPKGNKFSSSNHPFAVASCWFQGELVLWVSLSWAFWKLDFLFSKKIPLWPMFFSSTCYVDPKGGGLPIYLFPKYHL